MGDIWVRGYRPEDADGCAAVFWRGVHEGAVPAYDAAQRAAWLPERPSAEAFAARLDGMQVFIAVRPEVCGFMGLHDDGYLDFAFVMPELRGAGVAGLLYAALVNHAYGVGLRRLTVHASRMAEPFFRRQGWQVEMHEEVVRSGVALPRAAMSITLDPGKVPKG
ncbi:MAG: GNAT family N-acetyltransferase [Shimia sp.]